MAGTRDGVSQDRAGGTAPPPTRLPARADPLDPARARVVVGPLPPRPPAPRHAEGSLRPVVRGVPPCREDTGPPRAQRSRSRAGHGAGRVSPRTLLVDQRPSPGLPGLPRAAGRRRRGPVHQPVPRGHDPAPPGRPRGMVSRCQATRPAEQRRQARLAARPPGVGHALPVAAPKPRPARDPRLEGRLRPARWPRAPGDWRRDPPPQPGPHAGRSPGGRLAGGDLRTPGLLSHGLSRGRAGRGHPSARAVDGASAEGAPQDRRATRWPRTAPAPLRARPRPEARRPPGARPRAVRGRQSGVDEAGPAGARRRGPHDRRHAPRDRGARDPVGRGGRRRGGPRPRPTAPGLRRERQARCRRQPRVAMAGGPWRGASSPSCARAGDPWPLRWIGRGGTLGVAGVRGHACVACGGPRCRWLDHSAPMDAPLAPTERGLLPMGSIQRQPC
jgi:hypothetical protein